jgi:hypothetical protein
MQKNPLRVRIRPVILRRTLQGARWPATAGQKMSTVTVHRTTYPLAVVAKPTAGAPLKLALCPLRLETPRGTRLLQKKLRMLRMVCLRCQSVQRLYKPFFIPPTMYYDSQVWV